MEATSFSAAPARTSRATTPVMRLPQRAAIWSSARAVMQWIRMQIIGDNGRILRLVGVNGHAV